MNGVEIPKLGLARGSSAMPTSFKRSEAATLVTHIDTAQAYQNERGVGEGIRTSGVDRAEMFVTTKLAAEVKSYAEAVASIDQSLKTLGLDYIDMMIIHSPQPWMQFGVAVAILQAIGKRGGRLRALMTPGKLRAHWSFKLRAGRSR